MRKNRETSPEDLTLVQVNEVLDGTGWIAAEAPLSGTYNGELAEGFELFQGYDNGEDIITTSDSLPVLSAREEGNNIRFAMLQGGEMLLHEIIGEPELERIM